MAKKRKKDNIDLICEELMKYNEKTRNIVQLRRIYSTRRNGQNQK